MTESPTRSLLAQPIYLLVRLSFPLVYTLRRLMLAFVFITLPSSSLSSYTIPSRYSCLQYYKDLAIEASISLLSFAFPWYFQGVHLFLLKAHLECVSIIIILCLLLFLLGISFAYLKDFSRNDKSISIFSSIPSSLFISIS